MADQLIEFLAAPRFRASCPAPIPASQMIPDWVKQMPAEHPGGPRGENWRTVKKCPPFIDAMSAGYLIPLAADLRLTMTADGVRWECDLPLVQTHVAEQFPGAPFAGRAVVKFMNPWIVRTPPGYSCLFVQPLNRFHFPFQVLAGVVETDEYYREVNFPCICLVPPGQSVTLAKGTPIAQLIPFRRESWEGRIADSDSQRRLAEEEAFKETSNLYKERMWRRKGYE